MADMTTDEARDDLEHLDDFEVGDVYNTARRSLATLAAMRVEEDWRIVPTDSNGGKYETRRHTRLVSEWRDADSAEAAANTYRTGRDQAAEAAD